MADFYVAVIKARSNPSYDDELWITDWNDWGLLAIPYFQLKLTDVTREKVHSAGTGLFLSKTTESMHTAR